MSHLVQSLVAAEICVFIEVYPPILENLIMGFHGNQSILHNKSIFEDSIFWHVSGQFGNPNKLS